MIKIDSHHPLWTDAWEWVLSQHESPDDADLHSAFVKWLELSPEHRAVYEAASRLWLLSGLIPASQEKNNS